MARLARVIVLLALCSTGIPAAPAEDPPAKPEAKEKAKPKVEFRWLDTSPTKGLTEDKGVQTTCGPGLSYPHLKPVLTSKAVAGTRISNFVINGFDGPRESFTVHFQLTKEARKTLVEACGGERRKELGVFVDGKYWSSWNFVPAESDKFEPRAAGFLTKADAERVAEACQPPGGEPLNGDAIRVDGVKPDPPAVLKAGEKLEVRFSYSLESADQVVILVHPTTKNKYDPHPVSAYKKGQGLGEGWFVFNDPTSIEEVQIRMVDVKSKKTLAVVKHPVKAEWK